MIARCSPPWPLRSPWPSPARFSRPALTRPWTGCFQIAVRTISPRHGMSRGVPTFTETTILMEAQCKDRRGDHKLRASQSIPTYHRHQRSDAAMSAISRYPPLRDAHGKVRFFYHLRSQIRHLVSHEKVHHRSIRRCESKRVASWPIRPRPIRQCDPEQRNRLYRGGAQTLRIGRPAASGHRTLDRQVERVLRHLEAKPTDLERYI